MLNGFVSVANVGADAFISVSTVIAPHGPMLDNMAMTTPIPGDDILAHTIFFTTLKGAQWGGEVAWNVRNFYGKSANAS